MTRSGTFSCSPAFTYTFQPAIWAAAKYRYSCISMYMLHPLTVSTSTGTDGHEQHSFNSWSLLVQLCAKSATCDLCAATSPKLMMIVAEPYMLVQDWIYQSFIAQCALEWKQPESDGEHHLQCSSWTEKSQAVTVHWITDIGNTTIQELP